MESTASRGTRVRRWIGNLSLLTAIVACLMVWGGVTLLFTHPSPPHASTPSAGDPMLPRPVAQWEGVSQARRSLVNLLLFRLPVGLGAIACAAGAAALAWGRERDPDTSRRALIALVLSTVPVCLCTLWILAFAASPLLGR